MTSPKEKDQLGQKILDTAQSLFNKYGVEEVSMHQVAKTAGIGQGTLYRRYPNKGKICFTLMEERIERFMEELDAYLHDSSEESAALRLRTIMYKVVLLINEDLEMLRVMLVPARLEDVKDTLDENPPFIYLREQIQSLLELATEQGDMRPIDPVITSILLSTLPRADIILYLRDMGYSADQVAEQYCRSFVDTLFVDRT